MSSFLCFVCHSTVNADTNEETREKYREVIGMNLCPDSHLCYICCYFLNKMCLFKSICLKRSLEYPVLFSEKGTINLQRSETSVSILCPEDICLQHLNTRYHFYNNNDNSQSDFNDNNYCELQDDRNFDINDTLLKTVPIENFRNEDYFFVTKDNVDLFNEELILQNLEPVRITQNDLVNGEWTQYIPKKSNYKNNTLLELDSCKNDVNIEGLVMPVENNEPIAIHNDNIPIEIHNDNVPIEIHSNNLPIAVHSDNVPIEIHNDNVPIVIHNDNVPIEIHNDNLPSEIRNNNVPIAIHNDNIPISIHDNVPIPIHNVNVPIAIHNDNVRIAIDNDSVPIVVRIDGKDVPIECNDTRNLHVISGLNYSDNDYETVEKCDSNIENNLFEDERPNNINDNATNISEIDLNENEIDTNETTPDNSLSEEETSSVADNPSDVEDNEESTEKKGKSKKNNKDLYKKITLTLEEQKMELEKGRKDEKYIAASYKCHSCAMFFHFKDTYQTHMMRHEESNGEHFCSVCSLRFANPAVLRSHTANHGVRYRCRRCGAVVRARQRPTHARHCAGTKDCVNCHQCGRVFQSVQHYQQHLRRFHGTSLRRYLCNVCGKSYDTRPHLRTHIITHINRKFECDQCSSTFSSPYTLNQHKKKHAAREPELHHCAACQLSYTTRKSLLAHMRNALAHKESVYKCGVCGRTCPSLGALEGHTAAVHTRSRHLACRLCHKRYSTTRALVRHMASHKEGRPVPLCHSCGATFKSITILKRHLKNVCEKDARKCQTIDEELLRVAFFE